MVRDVYKNFQDPREAIDGLSNAQCCAPISNEVRGCVVSKLREFKPNLGLNLFLFFNLFYMKN